MATAKPDITQLEHLVGLGRHADALDGYLKLLAARPNDPLLKARVEMLKDAVAQAGQRQSPFARPETDLRSTYVVTPEEVADSYVLAGRYDDAMVLLEKVLHQRPGEKAILDRIDRVKRLKAAGPDGSFEATSPQQSAPGMNRAPPPAKEKPAAFGNPKSGAGKAASPGFGQPKSSGGAARAPSSDRLSTLVATPSAETLRAAQQGTSRPAPVARGRAVKADPVDAAVNVLSRRSDTMPTTPVVTDDPSSGAMAERTLLSPPPTRPMRRQPVEATVIAAPSEHLLERSRTDEVSSTNPVMSMAALEEHTAPAREMRDPSEEDAAKTLLVRIPTGLHAELAASDDVSGGFISQEIVHGERTQMAPPPVFEPDEKRPPRKR